MTILWLWGHGSAVALFAATATHPLDHILGLLNSKALRKRDAGNGHIAQAIGAVATNTRQVYMPLAVTRVIVVAHTVLLRATTIVYLVKQVCIGQTY